MQQISDTFSQKQIVSTISSKGQITLPVAIRQYLGIDINDKVAFIVEQKGEVKLTQVSYPDIKSLQGAAGSLKKPLSWKKMKQIAYEDRNKQKYGQ